MKTIDKENKYDELPPALFDDLQPLFDDQSRRLAALLERPEAAPDRLNHPDARTLRLRMLRAWGLFSLFCIAASLYWGIALWYHNHDIYYCIFSLILEGVFIFLSVDSLVTTLSFRRHNPARAGFDSMLRYARRSGMRPLYKPQKKRHHPLAPDCNTQFIIPNLKRTATIGIAASFTLVLVSCASIVGDGYTMTQDHDARTEAVGIVTYIINNL